ncbi:YraN family protein [uncultured Thermanaerothrix sp.]|uniref:YraN family protein n=1 Tax=uncultured Thermanaerothrix sp. TaxID=1195149 RepID=UPI0026256771|nr:YraN family protein [uncultured Thermanaerothrix sp.]
MKSHNRSLGAWGERLAATFLTERGFEVLGRNIYTPYGELDLVIRQADEVVFVEVKTRASDTFGWPETALTPRKRERLLKAALYYLEQHPEFEGDWRIDVIAIRRLTGDTSPEVIWIEDVLA